MKTMMNGINIGRNQKPIVACNFMEIVILLGWLFFKAYTGKTCFWLIVASLACRQ